MNSRRLRLITLSGTSLAVIACGGDRRIDRPSPLYGESPIEYPLELWDQDVEGETLLRVRVTDAGAVDSVEVVNSSGQLAFDSAAIAGASALRFQPATRKGKRIAVWATVPVRFSKDPRPSGGASRPPSPVAVEPESSGGAS